MRGGVRLRAGSGAKGLDPGESNAPWGLNSEAAGTRGLEDGAARRRADHASSVVG